MQLESLSDWVAFFASADKFHDCDQWTALAHSYADDDSTLIFEKYNHRTPIPENPTTIAQFIIANDRDKNQLFSNFLFLSEHGFSLQTIIAGLENVSLQEDGAALVGKLGNTRLAVMTYSVPK